MTRGQQIQYAIAIAYGDYQMGDIHRGEFERIEISLLHQYHRTQARRKALADQARIERAQQRRPA